MLFFLKKKKKPKQKIFGKKTKGPNSEPKNRNRPKNWLKLKQTETDGFSTILVGFGWDFYKLKISVSVGQIKKTDRTEPVNGGMVCFSFTSMFSNMTVRSWNLWFVKLKNHEFVSLYIYAVLRNFETVLVFCWR